MGIYKLRVCIEYISIPLLASPLLCVPPLPPPGLLCIYSERERGGGARGGGRREGICLQGGKNIIVVKPGMRTRDLGGSDAVLLLEGLLVEGKEATLQQRQGRALPLRPAQQLQPLLQQLEEVLPASLTPLPSSFQPFAHSRKK